MSNSIKVPILFSPLDMGGHYMVHEESQPVSGPVVAEFDGALIAHLLDHNTHLRTASEALARAFKVLSTYGPTAQKYAETVHEMYCEIYETFGIKTDL